MGQQFPVRNEKGAYPSPVRSAAGNIPTDKGNAPQMRNFQHILVYPGSGTLCGKKTMAALPRRLF